MNKHNQILLSIRNSKKIINAQGTKYEAVRQSALEAGFQFSSDFYTFIWTDQALSSKQIRDIPLQIKINHFPQITLLTRKNKLSQALNAMKRYFSMQYEFYPQTFLLPMDHHLLLKTHKKNKSYIVKPENGCQGKGIYLLNNPSKIQKSSQTIVQRYITNPLLIDGLKFDLRIYVLVTCVQPLRVYLYQDGLGRFATEEFEIPNQNNLNDLYRHLTNYSINKNHDSFKVDEDDYSIGHKRLLSSLFSEQMLKIIYSNISDVVIKSILSVLPSLQNAMQLCKKQNPSSCFQILGFDVIMTDNGKFKLLQINQNSSLMTQTSVDKTLKKQMLLNVFKIIQTPIYNSQDRYENKVKSKDRHEMSKLGKFKRIYPCQSIEETQDYDKYFAKSLQLFRQRFGINLSREKQKKQITPKNGQLTPIQWNESGQFYSKEKLQQVYRPRTMKAGHRKKMLFY